MPVPLFVNKTKPKGRKKREKLRKDAKIWRKFTGILGNFN